MDTELKTEWVAALRSGDYEQGRSQLSYDGKYCCLGVLCEILVNKGQMKRDEDGPFVGYRSLAGDYEESVLPRDIAREVFGMIELGGVECTNNTGVYDAERIDNRNPFADEPEDGLTGALTTDNDRAGKTFAEIADIIEAKF